jgi:D-alanyl-D-alanine carboxypeptidase/D-alanyl-D-alanine-endopeptidase (penicillin-binding protein 4)
MHEHRKSRGSVTALTISRYFGCLLFASLLFGIAMTGCDSGSGGPVTGVVPPDIKAVFDKPAYKDSTWGLRVVDLDTGKALLDINPDQQFLIGSVRKLFSVGELLNQIGPDHTFDTPVYRQGTLSNTGTLQGNIVLVASGDLTMGGRTNADGTIAVTDFDHNESNSLGNAQLTKPDPLAGYAYLANQIAASGIKEITGEIVIDDRLFKPFHFRGEFDLKPIFVNDDVADVIITPTTLGQPTSFSYRPQSAALAINNAVVMSAAGSDININPDLPTCIGQPNCQVTLDGELPVGFVPPITDSYPLIRAFRIVDPSSYARTVLIEELRAAGVKVDAPTVELNPSQLLPVENSYDPNFRIAQLQGLPYSEDAKFIDKVSYNIGADTSILLYGLTQGAEDMDSALAAEKLNLQNNYGIKPAEYFFVDGSGGGETTATNSAVTQFLAAMNTRPTFPQYFASLPILAVDGSLATVTDFESDTTLAPAKGQVHAKPGTFVEGSLIKGDALAGYITTKSGRKLAYQVVVNNVPFKAISDVIQVFQDEGTISAILWRDN